MYSKNCPRCNKLQTYKYEFTLDNAINNNSLCRSCSFKDASKLKPQCQKGFKNLKNTGKSNIMHGTSIYEIWIQKFGEEEGARLIQQHKDRSKTNNKSKERTGMVLLDIFKNKYGSDEGQVQYDNWLKSQKNSGLKGKDNPSYGKPAHKLAGRGIKGYLDGLFFRSLFEMQYIYYRLENGDTIIGAETLAYRTKYIDSTGKNKTYHPDFLINNKFIVEVKPSAFLERNKEKIQAGRKRFKKNYIVETEETFPFLINQKKAEDLLNEGRLSFVAGNTLHILKNIKRMKYI